MLMMNLFICGTNFHSEEQDEELPMSANSSPSSTPGRSRKTVFCKSHNNRDKNPYATRGLDKFSALLADLEEKRQKIYAENGSDQDISFVRFVYKNSNDLVPVVVKLKDNNNNNNNNNKDDKKKKEAKTNKSTANTNTTITNEDIKEAQSSDQSHDKFAIETSVAVKEVDKPRFEKATKRSFLWRTVKWDRLRRPSYYLPVVVIMILLFLAVFGRSVAILCTSIGWYVVPTLRESATRKRTSSKIKKDYVKRLSEKRMVSEGLVSSPRVGHHTGGSKENNNNKSPTRQHGHQKSW